MNAIKRQDRESVKNQWGSPIRAKDGNSPSKYQK